MSSKKTLSSQGNSIKGINIEGLPETDRSYKLTEPKIDLIDTNPNSQKSSLSASDALSNLGEAM